MAALQKRLQADDLIAVLGGLQEIELFGSLFHEICGVGDALFQLFPCHATQNGVGDKGCFLCHGAQASFDSLVSCGAAPVIRHFPRRFQRRSYCLDNLLRRDMVFLVVFQLFGASA